MEVFVFGWLFLLLKHPDCKLRHSWCFNTTASSQRTFSVFSTSRFDSSTSSSGTSSTCSLLQCLLLHVLGVFPGCKTQNKNRKNDVFWWKSLKEMKRSFNRSTYLRCVFVSILLRKNSACSSRVAVTSLSAIIYIAKILKTMKYFVSS